MTMAKKSIILLSFDATVTSAHVQRSWLLAEPCWVEKFLSLKSAIVNLDNTSIQRVNVVVIVQLKSIHIAMYLRHFYSSQDDFSAPMAPAYYSSNVVFPHEYIFNRLETPVALQSISLLTGSKFHGRKYSRLLYSIAFIATCTEMTCCDNPPFIGLRIKYNVHIWYYFAHS